MLSSWGWHDVLVAGLIFLVTFIASLAVVSVILIKLPADYFSKSKEGKVLGHLSGGTRIAAIIGKNLLGAILVLVGIVLSLPGVPGQGILTILLGVMLLDIPGKRGLEQKIISRQKVRQTIDKMRERFGRPPLILD